MGHIIARFQYTPYLEFQIIRIRQSLSFWRNGLFARSGGVAEIAYDVHDGSPYYPRGLLHNRQDITFYIKGLFTNYQLLEYKVLALYCQAGSNLIISP
jgi:hypothetical protein